MSKRNTFVPKHPDPDRVLAGSDLSKFPNRTYESFGAVPAVENPDTDVWEDGDGTPITEDPYEYILLK